MKTSGETDRLERAQSLRKKIDELTTAKSSDAPASETESPAEFIHRRMREIEQKERKQSE